jgi:hypothetical protein
MACTENTFNSKILNLNEIIFPENTTNKKVRIENKIYEGIKSFFENFLLKVKSFAITKNRIIKLEMNSFQMLTNLETLGLNSSSIEIVDKNTFNRLNSLQYLYLNENVLSMLRRR